MRFSRDILLNGQQIEKLGGRGATLDLERLKAVQGIYNTAGRNLFRASHPSYFEALESSASWACHYRYIREFLPWQPDFSACEGRGPFSPCSVGLRGFRVLSPCSVALELTMVRVLQARAQIPG